MQQPLYPNNNITNMQQQLQPLTQMQEQKVSYEEMANKYRGDSEALC